MDDVSSPKRRRNGPSRLQQDIPHRYSYPDSAHWGQGANINWYSAGPSDAFTAPYLQEDYIVSCLPLLVRLDHHSFVIIYTG